MYAKRADIINGRTEPTAEEVGPDAPALVASGEGGEAVSGIPHFWLKAMQNNDEVAEAITEADEKILEHLEDIQSVLLLESKGFMLTFKFSENEHFANTELTKKYVMVDEEEPTLDNAEGTEIQWKPGKNVTVKIMRKKQKHKSGKGSRTITKEEPCDSFFNFFAPPKLPENDEEMDEEEEENLQNLLEECCFIIAESQLAKLLLDCMSTTVFFLSVAFSGATLLLQITSWAVQSKIN